MVQASLPAIVEALASQNFKATQLMRVSSDGASFTGCFGGQGRIQWVLLKWPNLIEVMSGRWKKEQDEEDYGDF